MTDATVPTVHRAHDGDAGSLLTVVPLPGDWNVPDHWRRVTTDTEDGERRGYDGFFEFLLDLDRRVLTVRAVSAQARRDESGPGTWVSWLAAVAGSVPRVLELKVLGLQFDVGLAAPGAVTALLDEVTPLAQQIADNLAAVPGTAARDWTVAAREAHDRAAHLIDRYPYRGTEYDHPYERSAFLAAADFFAEFPGLVEPAWVDLPDGRLDHMVDHTARKISMLKDDPDTSRRLQELIDRSAGDTPLKDGARDMPVVLGMRAWLYDYRARQAAGQTVVDATRWTGGAALAPRVRADMADAELGALAEEACSSASSAGVKLLGAPAWLAGLRADRRREVRAELTRTRGQITELESALKPAKVRRRALVADILGWGENDTDAALARDAGLSHTAVKSIRDTLAEDDDTDE